MAVSFMPREFSVHVRFELSLGDLGLGLVALGLGVEIWGTAYCIGLDRRGQCKYRSML
jgi:hypothetical protein